MRLNFEPTLYDFKFFITLGRSQQTKEKNADFDGSPRTAWLSLVASNHAVVFCFSSDATASQYTKTKLFNSTLMK